MSNNKLSRSAKFYMVLIFIFLYAPIVVMTLFSFNESTSTYIFTGFSLKWWIEMFSKSAAMNALVNSLILAVSSAVVATLLGTLATVGIFNSKNKMYKKMMMSVTNIPMMNPEIVTGISMMLLFVFVGTIVNKSSVLGFKTLLISHVTFCLPYVILNILPKLKQFDMNIYEAAVDLGCKPLKAFFKVVLPNIASGIVTGFIMSFTLSLDDFIISYFTNGPSFQTLPIYVFSMTKKRVTPDMYALSTLVFVVILLLLVFMNIAQSKSNKKDKSDSE